MRIQWSIPSNLECWVGLEKEIVRPVDVMHSCVWKSWNNVYKAILILRIVVLFLPCLLLLLYNHHYYYYTGTAGLLH